MSPILGILASSTPAAVGDYESISTTTLSTATSTITFSSIPATFKHLQIRAFYLNSATLQDSKINFNSDTASNYSRHGIYGDGSSAGAYGVANETFIPFGYPQSTSYGTSSVIDILDYANTNKYKTVRTLYGSDANGSGLVALVSGSWRNTAAVTSIVLSNGSGNFSQYSSFALYGIK